MCINGFYGTEKVYFILNHPLNIEFLTIKPEFRFRIRLDILIILGHPDPDPYRDADPGS